MTGELRVLVEAVTRSDELDTPLGQAIAESSIGDLGAREQYALEGSSVEAEAVDVRRRDDVRRARLPCHQAHLAEDLRRRDPPDDAARGRERAGSHRDRDVVRISTVPVVRM